MISILNPSVCSLKLAATSPFRGDIAGLDLKLQFAITTNLYMLPERELASPQAMTEGCHKKTKRVPKNNNYVILRDSENVSVI